MQTVGEVLKKARLNKQLTLEQISSETRISLGYLNSIENNDFNSLPPATFSKGFMRNYARVVGVDPQIILALFRRDYDQDNKGRIITRQLTSPSKKPQIYITPSLAAILGSIVLSVIILTIFIRQMFIFLSAPPLQIVEPQPNEVLRSPITIIGKTSANASVTINSRPVSSNDEGTFTGQISLTQGEHLVIITTTSRSQKQKTIELPLIVQ